MGKRMVVIVVLVMVVAASRLRVARKLIRDWRRVGRRCHQDFAATAFLLPRCCHVYGGGGRHPLSNGLGAGNALKPGAGVARVSVSSVTERAPVLVAVAIGYGSVGIQIRRYRARVRSTGPRRGGRVWYRRSVSIGVRGGMGMRVARIVNMLERGSRERIGGRHCRGL